MISGEVIAAEEQQAFFASALTKRAEQVKINRYKKTCSAGCFTHKAKQVRFSEKILLLEFYSCAVSHDLGCTCHNS